MTLKDKALFVGLQLLMFMGLLALRTPLEAQITQPGTPSGAILYFNATACPSGWSEYTTARGLYIVGRVSGGTLATAVGSALTNQENRTHTHSTPQLTLLQGQGSVQAGTLALNNAGGALGFYDGASFFQSSNSVGTIGASTYGISASTTGTATGLAPYVQLLVCQKS